MKKYIKYMNVPRLWLNKIVLKNENIFIVKKIDQNQKKIKNENALKRKKSINANFDETKMTLFDRPDEIVSVKSFQFIIQFVFSKNF